MKEQIQKRMTDVPPIETIVGEVRPFAQDYPEFSEAFLKVREGIIETFLPYHNEYCLNVSNFSAVPDPTGLAFVMYLGMKYPEYECFECGSGFSTFILRILYDYVLSVETDKSWRIETGKWLTKTNVAQKGEVIANPGRFFRSFPETKHWAFLDGDPRTRRIAFKTMIAKEMADFILIDDLQFIHYRRPFVRALEERGFPYSFYHLHKETLGIRERHMGIAIRKGFELK